MNNENEYNSEGFIILRENYSNLYNKINYSAPVMYVVDRICEYDIRHANTSIMRSSNLISKEALDKLDTLGSQRNIQFGLLLRKVDSDISAQIKEYLKRGIIEAKRCLFESNLIKDEDILSIKNDAVFIIGRKLKHRTFGNVEFAEKNVYSVFMRFGKYEFYYNHKKDIMEVKGLSDDIIQQEDHQTGMIDFIKRVMGYLRLNNITGLRKFIKEFSILYKSRELPVQYYKEMNADNIYHTIYDVDDFMFNYDDIGSEMLPEINITFNYTHYILPVIQQFY